MLRAHLSPIMKSLPSFVLTIFLIVVSVGAVRGRLVRIWSDQELLEKSEVVVIAIPTATHETKEKIGLPGFEAQPVIGVETEFAVSAVLKGSQATKTLILHHYRADKLEVPNAPTFLAFDPKKKQRFRLYLIREADGRYAPAAGQIDLNISVREESPK